jgi:hypothetical protein
MMQLQKYSDMGGIDLVCNSCSRASANGRLPDAQDCQLDFAYLQQEG